MVSDFLAAPLPYLAIPALVAVTGALFVYGGIVRLIALKATAPEHRATGMTWGFIGVVIGLAIMVGAAMLYAGY